ncbi:purine permease 10 [Hibiscus trionum]|uniref:Probable purine permease n=1 Tax=Hibiscus trionum TaxID=183268 RepID=A0A9W7HQJ2_HIBTR|nr:purine permease 10 [Hibiscus trionum]
MADHEAKGASSSPGPVSPRPDYRPPRSNMLRWFRIALYAIFVLGGQIAAVMLSRLYFEKGGTSKWVLTLVQCVGFPIILPYYFISQRKAISFTAALNTKPSTWLLRVFAFVYLGLLAAGNGYLYSVAFEYLPVSTVALISASQLAFNAFFSYFLNSQKFTPLIINSLFLLTISSVLLVANNSSERPAGESNGRYVLGFICAIFGTATYGLNVASQQLTFRKVLKSESFKVVLDLVIFQSLVATIATSVGLFASGEWELLKTEMDVYLLGRTSYVMTLVGTAVSWQAFVFGGVALVFELSALFSNVIGVFGLPFSPIAAMLVYHDKMSSIKGISMALAIGGFISYAYQQYLDDRDFKAETNKDTEVSEA